MLGHWLWKSFRLLRPSHHHCHQCTRHRLLSEKHWVHSFEWSSWQKYLPPLPLRTSQSVPPPPKPPSCPKTSTPPVRPSSKLFGACLHFWLSVDTDWKNEAPPVPYWWDNPADLFLVIVTTCTQLLHALDKYLCWPTIIFQVFKFRPITVLDRQYHSRETIQFSIHLTTF